MLLHQATAFAAHGGFTVTEAIGWHKHMLWMPEAGPWMEAGYTPQQAHEIICLSETETDAENWLPTGIPAHRVIAYLQAGITAHEAPTYETSPDATPQTLAFMSALLGK